MISFYCGKKEIKLYYNGRLTPEGKGRWQLPQGSVISCRGKLGGGEGREAAAATNAPPELLQPSRKWHIGYQYSIREG